MAGSAWTNQLVSLIILSALLQGFSGLFVYSPTPGAGNLSASISAASGTDPYLNPYVAGIAAYVMLAGATTAVQLGQGNFAGSSTPGLFLHNLTSPAFSDPMLGGFSSATTGASAVLYSGQGTSAATGSGIQAFDSVSSGVPGGEVSVVGGLMSVQGTMNVQGNLIDVGSGSITQSNFNMSPAMATPPNLAQVNAGTATLVQLCAFAAAMYNSMHNRGMFN